MTDVRDVAAALAGTPLAGLPVGYGLDGTILIPGVDPARLLEFWRAARALVPVTGRWPVMVMDEDDDPLDTEYDPEFASVDESELADLDRAARTADPWRHDDRILTGDELPYLVSSRSGVDLTVPALASVPLPATSQTMQHWLYRRVLSDPELTAQLVDFYRYELSTDCWFTPHRVMLTLLPTASSWLAPRWVSYFDTLPPNVAAALWQWHERWGAELVACWGTMLQFVVQRPPAPGDEAWEAAGQLLELATHLHLDQWELAAALPEGRAWFLHRRP